MSTISGEDQSGAYRVPQGGQLDRSRTLSFTFNGRVLTGHAGDTLASALLANGISVVARSFKYHRPRGIFSAGVEEPNALLRVEINGAAVPLVRATMQPLVEGMIVTSENCFPSVDFDLARIFDCAHALLPAGFYNKTFKWPGWRPTRSKRCGRSSCSGARSSESPPSGLRLGLFLRLEKGFLHVGSDTDSHSRE